MVSARCSVTFVELDSRCALVLAGFLGLREAMIALSPVVPLTKVCSVL
jgi:hypothetical protein